MGLGEQVNGQTGSGGHVESNLYLNYYAYKLHQQSTDVLKKMWNGNDKHLLCLH